MNQQIADWYEAQTGLDAERGSERVAKIETFLKSNRATLDDVEIYVRNVNSKYGVCQLVNKPGREKIGYTGKSNHKTTEYYIQLRK